MSDFIYNHCELYNINDVIDKLSDGDRKLPKKLLKIIEQLMEKDMLDDLSEIVCGCDAY